MQEEFLAQEKANKAERQRLNDENIKLQMQLMAMGEKIDKLNSGSTPILNMGKEKDFYDGEQLEIIAEIIKEYLEKSVDENSRRHDVLQSILDANPVKGIPDMYRQMIKNAFDGYKDFNSKKIQDALKEIGIEVVNHSGHYKIAFHGDARYLYEAATTPSDWREGKNVSADICKLMF